MAVNRPPLGKYSGRTPSWTERIAYPLEQSFLRGRHALRIVSENETQFGENLVANRFPVIQLNSSYGTSALRDIETVTGSGSVSSGGGKITISTGATASSTAELAASEVGRYAPGYSAQVSLGIRVPDINPVGDQEARWGGRSPDGNDGFYFGIDATGIFVAYVKGGEETITYQGDWNIDKLDGTGASGITLDLTNGNVYQIEFTWFGYGQVLFGVIEVLPEDISVQHFIACHQYRPTGTISIETPNLNVFAEVLNADTAQDYSVDVGGRQYSIVGAFNPRTRIVSDWRDEVTTTTTVVPLISFRRKAAFRDRSVKVDGFDLKCVSHDCIFEIRVNGTLTNASWGTPTNHTAAETANESDTSATAITGGVVIWQQLVTAGQGSQGGAISQGTLDIDIPDQQPVTLCVRSVSGTNGTASAVFRLREEW